MKSERIEFIRFDDLTTGILMGGKPYILTYGNSHSSKQVITPYNQIDLLEKISDILRYNNLISTSIDIKKNEIESFSNKIKPLLVDIDDLTNGTHHLELYLNPSELALIPFELLLNKSKKPYFLQENNLQIFITRNFRRNKEKRLNIIPKKPRVLFIHSKPKHKSYLNQFFSDLPYKDHALYIKKALKYWGDNSSSYKELSNETFEQFKTEILVAIEEEKPFTHIHILAHGSLIFDYKQPSNFEYGIAFYSNEPIETSYKATPAQEIKDFFNSIEEKNNLPYMVNYMICDGANFVNGMKANKNPVQVTFEAGIPVVLGSQFPLSMKGSTYITSELYKALFVGEDIRSSLMKIKEVLYKKQDEYGHDWTSLVSYIDFPDNYNLQLISIKNELQLTILNNLRDKSKDITKDDFIRIKVQVETAIKSLKANIIASEENPDLLPEKHILESNGLIASAYKRLAEGEFKKSELFGINTIENQFQFLENSKSWYLSTSKKNLSHYWSTSQYVSLSIILEGVNDENISYWNICKIAALNDIETNPNSYWAYGALIELNLLSEITNNIVEFKRETIEYVNKLILNAKYSNQHIAIKSTLLQLIRYSEWWMCSEFKIPTSFLVNDTDFLNKITKNLKHSLKNTTK
jgi:hypothetical protein